MASISSLGVGSGLDLSSIVSGLVDAERVPVENRLSFKEQTITTKLSAFGALKSSLSLFQGTLGKVQSVSTYNSKTVSLSDESVFTASTLSNAEAGSYSVEVTALAASHSLASSAASVFGSPDDLVGEGTMTIRLGTTTTMPYSFMEDTTKTASVISVNESNGNTTLSGLRDYINENDFGVRASIINDGTGYRLTLTSENSGAANSMEITVSGDGDGDDTNNTGLSQLAFNASAQTSMLQTVAAQDAALRINGLDITRDTNTITGVIEGVTLSLKKDDMGNVINMTIADDNSEIVAAIDEFIQGFNGLNETIKALTKYDATTDESGLLIGDFTVRSISSQLRNVVFGNVTGLQGSIRSLVDIGIGSNSDGSLKLDSDRLNEVLGNNVSDVEALFKVKGQTTDNGIRFLSSTADTQPGDYAVNISSINSSGALSGTDNVTSLTVSDSNNNMTILIDGISTGNITLTNATYVDEATLASEIQAQINSATPMVDNNLSVTVSYDTANDQFVITSDTVGSGSAVEITAVDINTNIDFGFSVGAGIAGTDLIGSINGQSATAEGNILTSELGDSKGISLEIAYGSTGNRGNVSLSQGVGSIIDELMDNFLKSNGTIAGREDGLKEGLKEITEERLKLDLRIESLEARLIKQFSALDSLIAQFNNTSSFLTQQLANLPKPNSVGNNN
jgi:flagellar hook-associated protein 2